MGMVHVRGTHFIEAFPTIQENSMIYTLRRSPCYAYIATHSQSLPETLVLRRLSVLVLDILHVNYTQEIHVHDGLIDEVIVELSYLLCVFNITAHFSTSGKKILSLATRYTQHPSHPQRARHPEAQLTQLLYIRTSVQRHDPERFASQYPHSCRLPNRSRNDRDETLQEGHSPA